MDVLYKITSNVSVVNTEHHDLSPMKIHPTERKLHHIMMKLDHKHSKH